MGLSRRLGGDTMGRFPYQGVNGVLRNGRNPVMAPRLCSQSGGNLPAKRVGHKQVT